MKLDIFKEALKIRLFEYSVISASEQGYIQIPYYLCIGQEILPALCAHYLPNRAIFAQHRAHGYYLAYGGQESDLIDELLGLNTGCAQGKGGSASIHCPSIRMFGHSGFMGDNIPIGVGYSLATDSSVLIVAGDAAAEEDYSITAAGFAATRKAKVVFICDDNGLSILTPTSVRRSWSLAEVFSGMGIVSRDMQCNDPDLSTELSLAASRMQPSFFNIHVQRAVWHAGPGFDGISQDDYLATLSDKFFDLRTRESLANYIERIVSLWGKSISIQASSSMRDFLFDILDSKDKLRP